MEFLIKYWSNDYMAPFIRNKKIFVNYTTCTKFEVVENSVVATRVGGLSGPAHEEADTKIVFHAVKIQNKANLVIRCSDTDVAVKFLGNMQHLSSDVKVWM